MRLTGEGLFAVDVGRPLTTRLFTELLARGKPFLIKADYRGVPPPIEELDLVHLHPEPRGAPPGTLVLAAVDDDGGFEFTWTPTPGTRPMARVLAVERPGAVVRLDARGWRVLGRALAASPTIAAIFSRARAFMVRVWRPMPPGRAPLTIAPAEHIVAAVRAKWAVAAEVEHLVAESDPALEAWEQLVFDRFVDPGARVLVVGCGGGRESLALAERGFRVTGIDFVPALVDEARRRAAGRGLPVTFEAATVEELARRHSATFDAILATTPVYEQTPGRARRVAFLRALRRLTAPGGLVVLCAAWYPDRGPRRAMIDGARWLLRRLGVRAAAEPGDRFTYHVSIASDHKTACFYHRFQRPEEIAREIRAAGLAGEPHPEGPWLLRQPPAVSDGDAILALLRGAPVSARDDAAWERLRALAEREGVAPLLHACLDAGPAMGAAVPSVVRVRLRQSYEQTWGRSVVLATRWREIVAALEAAGIRGVALKGIALLESGHYEDPGLRPMTDLDVLVRDREFDAARTALLRAGWEQADGDDAAANAFRGYSHLKRGGVVLDLHRDLAGYPRVTGVLRVDHEALWRRARPLPRGGWTLSAEDHLLHLAVHLVLGSEFGRLLNFVDVARVVTRENLAWETVLDDATRWRAREVLGYVLRVAATSLDAPVPEEVLSRLSQSGAARIAPRVLGTMGPPTLMRRPGEARLYLAETLLMDRARWVLRVATTTLFPPTPWLRFHYGARSWWRLGVARTLHPLRVCARGTGFPM
jgi:SAM-dependent methyltransferase